MDNIYPIIKLPKLPPKTKRAILKILKINKKELLT